jgi:quercetin dioxygenase-like cupin family protein
LLRFAGKCDNNPDSFGESENRRIKEDGEGIMDLIHAAEFSAKNPVKKDLMKTAGSNIVLVCLEAGQVIPSHPEPYAVVFVVLQGEGVITSGTTENPVKPLHLVSVKKDENRGIRCNQRRVLLGIREDI